MTDPSPAQPISIVTHNLHSSSSPYSPQSNIASSVTSLDWSSSSRSSSLQSHHSFPREERTPRRAASCAVDSLTGAVGAVGLDSDEGDAGTPSHSPSRARRVRLVSGSTAPTSLLSEKVGDDAEDGDSEEGGLLIPGGRLLAASAPTLSFKRKPSKGKEPARQRAQTDVALKGRGGLEALVGILPGETADELASWINASPSPFEPSTPLTATALDAIDANALKNDELPLAASREEDAASTPQPKKISIGFIAGPGVPSNSAVDVAQENVD